MKVELIFYFLSFFFNDTATTEIYTLSLHDALPIYRSRNPLDARRRRRGRARGRGRPCDRDHGGVALARLSRRNSPCRRSEEHTSELQSRQYLVCRLLLEKKKKNTYISMPHNKHYYK